MKTAAQAFNWEPPDKFIVTIQSLMLKNQTGEWITIVRPDKEVDLFSDQAKVTLFNSGKIPDGEYLNFKLAISETVRVSEADHFGNRTREGGRVIIGGTARNNFELPGEITSFIEKSPTWTDKEEGEIKATINFDNEDEDDIIEITGVRDFAEPFVIKKGSFINVVVSMNLLGTCYQINPSAFKRGMPKKKAMLVFPPRYVNEVRFTVDNRTELLQPDEVLIKF